MLVTTAQEFITTEQVKLMKLYYKSNWLTQKGTI